MATLPIFPLFGFLIKIGADKLIDHIIADTDSNSQPTPNKNTTKYEQINLNYRKLPSYLGNVSPKRTSGRAPGTSFGHKIRIFTDNMYIYIQNKEKLSYIHLYIIVLSQ